MRLKVLKYDKDKAKKKFVLLKFLELFAVFLFVVGFHGLGSLIYNKWYSIYIYIWAEETVTYFSLWVVGIAAFFIGIIILACLAGIVYLIYIIFRVWFKANWRWAQTLSEDEDTKKERLKEQGKLKLIKQIKQMESDRKAYGYCVGDKIIIKKFKNYPEGCSMPSRLYGKEATIIEVTSWGGFYIKELNVEEGSCSSKEIAKVIKMPIPKKPKLNPTRQKEVDERKKKKCH